MSLAGRLLAWVREFIQFGLVGATAYVVDVGLFNLLQYGPLAVLAGHPNTAQFVAATIATGYSWVANRVWTYRGRTRDNATREAVLFFFANACGIGISQFCLLFTHHILGLASALADNVAVYVVGFALGLVGGGIVRPALGRVGFALGRVGGGIVRPALGRVRAPHPRGCLLRSWGSAGVR